jgi:ketosteroid isomerase-like protein
MTDSETSLKDREAVRGVLELWATTTRKGLLDEVLQNHAADLVIFDVLPPMKYESAEAYRKSWGDWQPETPEEGKFELEDLTIVAGVDVAFAYGFIRCGGTMPNGRTFEDLVRATFCLQKQGDGWKVQHQHISKPLQLSGQ